MYSNLISNTDRQQQILQRVEHLQRIRVADICLEFEVSLATARRDLDALARQGKLQRVHGGAIHLARKTIEQPILQRQRILPDEKIRIGHAAASLVQEGETILLGSGSTVLEAARALRLHNNLTVLTNSLPVLNVLAEAEGIILVCLGGMLRDSELSFIGHFTEQALAEVRPDKVFIGTRAISLEYGLTHEYLPETMIDRAILKAGKEIIVLADHTKFGRTDTVVLAPLDRIHMIITDDQVPQDFVEAVQAKGIQVMIV